MNAQITCCVQSYRYKLIFPELNVNQNQILQTHIEDPFLHRVTVVPCCNDCCIDQRDSSILYRVVYVDENQQDNVLREAIANDSKGES